MRRREDATVVIGLKLIMIIGPIVYWFAGHDTVNPFLAALTVGIFLLGTRL